MISAIQPLLVSGVCCLLMFRRIPILGALIHLSLLIAINGQVIPDQVNPERLFIEDRLRREIASGTTEQKRNALFEIRNFRSERTSAIAIPALRDRDETVRATAASSVVFMRPREAVTALRPLLSDKMPFVRKEAAYALGKVGDPLAAVELIRSMQRDKDREVRAAAAFALGTTGSIDAVGPLTAALEKKPTENDEFIRRSAARSIGQLAENVRGLNESSQTPESFLPERYKTAAMLDITDVAESFPVFRSSEEVLKRVLLDRSETDDTRREAAFALGAIGNPSSVAVLRAQKGGPDPYLAEICREALIRMNIPE